MPIPTHTTLFPTSLLTLDSTITNNSPILAHQIKCNEETEREDDSLDKENEETISFQDIDNKEEGLDIPWASLYSFVGNALRVKSSNHDSGNKGIEEYDVKKIILDGNIQTVNEPNSKRSLDNVGCSLHLNVCNINELIQMQKFCTV